MADVQPRRRKSAVPSATRRVKATIILDVDTHAKLAAAAALRGCDRSTYAAKLISDGLRGMVVFDKRARAADQLDPASGEESAA